MQIVSKIYAFFLEGGGGGGGGGRGRAGRMVLNHKICRKLAYGIEMSAQYRTVDRGNTNQ